MLSTRSVSNYPSIIYSDRRGRLRVDECGLTPGTAAEVIKLALTLAAFLAGVLTMGTMM